MELGRYLFPKFAPPPSARVIAPRPSSSARLADSLDI